MMCARRSTWRGRRTASAGGRAIRPEPRPEASAEDTSPRRASPGAWRVRVPRLWSSLRRRAMGICITCGKEAGVRRARRPPVSWVRPTARRAGTCRRCITRYVREPEVELRAKARDARPAVIAAAVAKRDRHEAAASDDGAEESAAAGEDGR